MESFKTHFVSVVLSYLRHMICSYPCAFSILVSILSSFVIISYAFNTSPFLLFLSQAEARMIMAEQDQDLEELGAGVDRLNELGQNINQELKVQNQMLSDLDRDIDEVN
jgi:hypothetical protein